MEYDELSQQGVGQEIVGQGYEVSRIVRSVQNLNLNAKPVTRIQGESSNGGIGEVVHGPSVRGFLGGCGPIGLVRDDRNGYGRTRSTKHLTDPQLAKPRFPENKNPSE